MTHSEKKGLSPRWRSALTGGMLIAALCNIPYVANAALIWLIVGGAVAAYVSWRTEGVGTDGAYGALLGLLAGLTAIPFDMAIVYFTVDTREMLAESHRALNALPPALRGQAGEAMGLLSSPAGAAWASGFTLLIASAMFSTFGGWLVGRSKRNSTPPDMRDGDTPNVISI